MLYIAVVGVTHMCTPCHITGLNRNIFCLMFDFSNIFSVFFFDINIFSVFKILIFSNYMKMIRRAKFSWFI